ESSPNRNFLGKNRSTTLINNNLGRLGTNINDKSPLVVFIQIISMNFFKDITEGKYIQIGHFHIKFCFFKDFGETVYRIVFNSSNDGILPATFILTYDLKINNSIICTKSNVLFGFPKNVVFNFFFCSFRSIKSLGHSVWSIKTKTYNL